MLLHMSVCIWNLNCEGLSEGKEKAKSQKSQSCGETPKNLVFLFKNPTFKDNLMVFFKVAVAYQMDYVLW